jgi:hypothetical protein
MSKQSTPAIPEPSRRAILTAGPAAAATALAGGTVANAVALAIPRTAEVDPIFAILAEHRAATNAYVEASLISGDLADHTPEWEAANAVTQASIERQHASVYAVLTSQPTTLAGVVALLAQVGQGQFLEATEEAEDSRGFETVLTTWGHGDGDDNFTIASKGFLRRIAATTRGIIERGQA